MPFQAQQAQSKTDDWKIVGWISATKKQTKRGVLCSVKDAENNLVGWVLGDTLAKVLQGEVAGAPIKVPTNPRK